MMARCPLTRPLTPVHSPAHSAEPHTRAEKPAIRPPLKWAGGKRWQVPVVQPLWAPHANRRLVEPFCGGAALSLALRPTRALLNDINPHLINFYTWLKRGLRIEFAMENDREAFYRQRSRFNELQAAGASSGTESAALFYYLNRTGYNGLCRFNRRGSFNVPFGRYSCINYQRDFGEYRAVFRRWKLASVDFERLALEPGDFVYADPPYDVEFRQYSQGGFTLGRSGPHGEMAGTPHRPRRAGQSGHRTGAPALSTPRLSPDRPVRSPPHQLQRRSHAGPRSPRHQKPLNLVLRSAGRAPGLQPQGSLRTLDSCVVNTRKPPDYAPRSGAVIGHRFKPPARRPIIKSIHRCLPVGL